MKTVTFETLSAFKLNIKYLEMLPGKAEPIGQHIHPECEIYFNLSGDVSFMAGDRIYPVSRGSIIITRPYEYHHCIYHSDAVHRHYWALFSADRNEKYFDLFFRRAAGEDNLIMLSPGDTDRLAEVFDSFLYKELSPSERYLAFFKVMDILNSGAKKNAENPRLSAEISLALGEINKKFSEPFSVSSLAKALHLSVNTLERRFKSELGITPREYLLRRRMSSAVSLLSNGKSVTEAAEASGFSDCSHFIMQFKKQFGVTPAKYKKTAESAPESEKPVTSSGF